MELINYKRGETFDMESYLKELNAEYAKRIQHEEKIKNNGLEITEVAEEVEWLELN